MKRIKSLMTVLLVLLLLVMPVVSAIYVQAEETTNTDVNYNIELVVDASGSLAGSDAEMNRFTAIDIFLQTLRENGNNVGAVVYDGEIRVDTELTNMDSKSAKQSLSKEIKSIEVDGGYTNTGLALETAVNRLKSTNNGLDNIILLLSDGNTDLETDKEEADSLKKEENAIQECISEGIKVYGICLNHNGSADLNEFVNICNKTGGQFLEVKSSKNLVGALKDFYAEIFKTKYVTDTKKIEANGKVTKAIEVPSYGVEEVNITINNVSKIKNITLTKPNGVDLSKNEFSGVSSKIDDYYFIKITEPDAGTWQVTVSGAVGTEITFDYVFNTDNKVVIGSSAQNNSALLKEDVEFTVGFYENGKKLIGSNYYGGYSGTLVVRSAGTDIEPEFYPMESDGENGFKYTMAYTEMGNYEMYAVLSCGTYESMSDTLLLSIGNANPVFADGEKNVLISIKKIFNTSEEIDIEEYFLDEENSDLEFTMVASSYANEDISIDGTKVLLSDLQDGEFTIRAEDPMGGSVDGVFKVEVENLLFVIIGAVAAIIIIILLIVILTILKAKRRFFDGYLNIFSNSGVDDSNSRPLSAFRGKVLLADFGLQGHQFGTDMYFKVMKDNSVKGDASHKLQLVSSKPFFYQGPEGEQRVTKLDLNLNMSYDIRSHSNEDYDAIDDSICISLDTM